MTDIDECSCQRKFAQKIIKSRFTMESLRKGVVSVHRDLTILDTKRSRSESS